MTKAKPLPSQERLLHLFDYDKESGQFRRKYKKHLHAGGKVSGSKNRGYIIMQIDGHKFMAHRVAWKIITGVDPGSSQIDHINGDKADNRFANLRLASNAENNMNKGASAYNTSGFKGVTYYKNRQKWVARIKIDGEVIFLGGYQAPELAHMAYCKAAAELHGEFARGQ